MRTVKPKKCKVCKAEFKPFKSTQQVCSLDCAKILGKEKAAKKEAKEWRQRKVKMQREDVKYIKPKLQAKINQIARLIDSGLPCLATGHFGQLHGGHIFSRGGHTQMKYNLHNIHRQSAQSNNKQSHDGLMQERLSEEYGIEYLEYLKSLRGAEVVKKQPYELAKCYDRACDFYNDTKKIFETLQLPIPKRLRIIWRNKANKFIGYYRENEIFNTNQ